MILNTNTVIEGFLLGMSLIIPIGAQNAYVLRQGALGKHWLVTSVLCAFCDSILIIAGAFGVGGIIASSMLLKRIAVIGGVAFLTWYGGKSFIRAIKPSLSNQNIPSSEMAASKKTVILSALAFSLLNPHAILDTTVLIGSIAGQMGNFSERSSFCLGAVIASWAWFLSLGYFSRLLKPLLSKPIASRILDALVALLMWSIAFMLFYSEWTS